MNAAFLATNKAGEWTLYQTRDAPMFVKRLRTTPASIGARGKPRGRRTALDSEPPRVLIFLLLGAAPGNRESVHQSASGSGRFATGPGWRFDRRPDLDGAGSSCPSSLESEQTPQRDAKAASERIRFALSQATRKLLATSTPTPLENEGRDPTPSGGTQGLEHLPPGCPVFSYGSSYGCQGRSRAAVSNW